MNLLDTCFVVDLFRGDKKVSGFFDWESPTSAVTYGALRLTTRDRDFLEIAKRSDLTVTIY